MRLPVAGLDALALGVPAQMTEHTKYDKFKGGCVGSSHALAVGASTVARRFSELCSTLLVWLGIEVDVGSGGVACVPYVCSRRACVGQVVVGPPALMPRVTDACVHCHGLADRLVCPRMYVFKESCSVRSICISMGVCTRVSTEQAEPAEGYVPCPCRLVMHELATWVVQDQDTLIPAV